MHSPCNDKTSDVRYALKSQVTEAGRLPRGQMGNQKDRRKFGQRATIAAMRRQSVFLCPLEILPHQQLPVSTGKSVFLKREN